MRFLKIFLTLLLSKITCAIAVSQKIPYTFPPLGGGLQLRQAPPPVLTTQLPVPSGLPPAIVAANPIGGGDVPTDGSANSDSDGDADGDAGMDDGGEE